MQQESMKDQGRICPPENIIRTLSRLLCVSGKNGIVLQPEDAVSLGWILILILGGKEGQA